MESQENMPVFFPPEMFIPIRQSGQRPVQQRPVQQRPVQQRPVQQRPVQRPGQRPSHKLVFRT